jgi:hypothetical protein
LNENAFDIFDLSGNLWELQQDQSPASALFASVRGGFYGELDEGVLATSGSQRTFGGSGEFEGFRIVQVPEPATASLLVTGSLLVLRRKRRSKRPY